jgi:hypothetical protein
VAVVQVKYLILMADHGINLLVQLVETLQLVAVDFQSQLMEVVVDHQEALVVQLLSQVHHLLH